MLFINNCLTLVVFCTIYKPVLGKTSSRYQQNQMNTNTRWLNIEREPTEPIIELLEANTLGEPNKSMRYKHRRLRPKIEAIVEPYFISVKRQDKVIGMGCFCKRHTWNQGERLNSFYIRYFNFREGNRISQAQKQHKRKKKSVIKQELKQLLEPSGLAANQPTLFYSYLDPKNERSANLCSYFGFEPIRKFTTCLFSRLSPKVHPRVSQLEIYERFKMQFLLEQQYLNYNMLSFENLFFEDDYYVMRDEQGEIIAGVQANFEYWRIVEMPDFFGKMVMKVLPKVPLFKKLFNPDYKFVALSGIYIKKGYEQNLGTLLESVLGIHELTSGLMWLDIHSDLYRLVSKLPKGIMNYFYNGLTAHVIAKTINLSEKEKRRLTQKPAYITAFDMT